MLTVLVRTVVEDQDQWRIASLVTAALSLPGMAPHTVASPGRCSLFPLPFSQPQGACGGECFSLQVSERGKGAAWVRAVHPSWKGGKNCRLAAKWGFPEAIQILQGDGLQREGNAGRGFRPQLFPGWVGRSPKPAHCCQNLSAGKGKP